MTDNSASPRDVTPDAEVSSNPTVALYPFNNPMADVILRSCDMVDFYVYKNILSLASPFFMDMFSLTQPAPTISQGGTQPEFTESSINRLPIIPVPEDSRSLECLLRICYPLRDPVITGPTEIHDVLKAAIKYEMEQCTVITKAALRDLRASQPLQAYVVACRLGLEDEARAAAEHWKTTMPPVPVPESREAYIAEWSRTLVGLCYVPEMRQISAGTLYRLICFIRTGKSTTFCEPEAQLPVSPATYSPPPSPHDPATTKTHPQFNYHDADIILRSADQVDFHVHKCVLRLASSVLTDAIANCETDPKTLTLHGRAVLPISEGSCTLAWLLRLCYPLADPVPLARPTAKADQSTIPAHSGMWPSPEPATVVESALKYKMERATAFARRWLNELVTTAPTMAYFIAIRCGWIEEARHAAEHLARHCEKIDSEDLYTPAMENTPAHVYHGVLEYHHKYRAAVMNSHTEKGFLSSSFTSQSIWPGVLEPTLARARQNFNQTSWHHPSTGNYTVSALLQLSRQLDATLEGALREINLNFE